MVKISWSDSNSMQYHMSQYDNPKESTKAFFRFIEQRISNSSQVMDLGCGAGAATNFIGRSFPECNIIGVDSDPFLIEKARERSSNFPSPSKNVLFEVGDVYNLEKFVNQEFEGVISLQTISWLENWSSAMEGIYQKICPKWIGLTSLFYPGEISANILVKENIYDRVMNYNVISIPEFERHANSLGYDLVKIEEFRIEIDIPKPIDPNYMGTYTMRIDCDNTTERLQVSGPLLMPWYMILLKQREFHRSNPG